MKRTPVKSSNIAACGYDEDTRTLEVQFTNGNVYRYSDVPKETYEGLVSAESCGRYFHQNIRNAFKFAREGSAS